MAQLRWHTSFAFALLFAAACGGKSVNPAGQGGGSGGTGGAVGTGGTVTQPSPTPTPTPTGVPLPDPPRVAVLPPGQKFVFEVAYSNYAWIPSLNGVYVTSDGSVNRYDYYASMPMDGGPGPKSPGWHVTEAEIAAKYLGTTRIAGVDPKTLADMFGIVAGARQGALVQQQLCADAGTTTYTAWLYDPGTGTYTRVPLGQRGDTAIQNTAPEAKQLMTWLDRITGEPADTMCAFRSMGCGKTPCPELQACRPGEVPMWLDDARGCLTGCWPQAQCDTTKDCSACASPGFTCVVDREGLAHCSLAYCPSSGSQTTPMTCACAGGQLCAGGVDACRGTAATGFSCAAP
jgi:hypothetical protein